MLAEISDNYFFDNDYFVRYSDYYNDIVSPTEKFRMLFDTCLRRLPKGKIITKELMLEVLNENNTSRTKVKYNNGYVKVGRPKTYKKKAKDKR